MALFTLVAESFGAADVLFYGLALYVAYTVSLRKITAAERESFYRERPRSPKRVFLKGRVSLWNGQIHTNLPDRPEVYRMATD